MKNKICCIFNLAPHYRAPIYRLMDKELDVDFFFGDKVGSPIKKMDYSTLSNFKKELKNRHILNTVFLWQKGALRQIFKPYKHYIITGEAQILSSWCILLFSKILGKKVHAWTHGIKGDPETKYKFIAYYFFKLCDTVLLYGNHSRNVMISQGFAEKKLICIYNSLDYGKQIEVREKLSKSDVYKTKFGNELPVIAYIGRIQKSKRLEVLAEVIHQLKLKGTKVNLIFIGKNVEEDNLVENKVKKLEIQDQVWFYGPSYDEAEIGNLIFNADLCVSPGPLGLTALHSMVYGTPVITNDNFLKQMPEHEVITEGKTGSFFKDGDQKDLMVKIEQWIAKDDQERETIRQQAYQVIDETYNPFNQIKILKEVLSQ